MDVVKRKDAIEKGLKRYCTGKTCKNGHIAERYTTTRICVECDKIYTNRYRGANKDVVRDRNKRWRNNNIEVVKEKARLKHQENKDFRNAQIKEYYEKNKSKIMARMAKRRAYKIGATPKWADKEKIERMYIVARFLSKCMGEEYNVDHIIPLKGKNICGLHTEDNLQVITRKENLSKSNKF